MIFEEEHLYHVYNRSLNNRILFPKDENYLYFLKKIRLHLVPHCNIIAYCLMPNHFHIMLHTTDIEIKITNRNDELKNRSINYSIGILLRSYTNALQKQEVFNGSLFQQHTRAICLTKTTELSPSYLNTISGSKLLRGLPEEQYPQLCFNYIHDNPKKSNLVKQNIEWRYSSAQDYAGLRSGNLISRNTAQIFGLKFDPGY